MAAARKSKSAGKATGKKTSLNKKSRKKVVVQSRKTSNAYPLSGITVIDRLSQ